MRESEGECGLLLRESALRLPASGPSTEAASACGLRERAVIDCVFWREGVVKLPFPPGA